MPSISSGTGYLGGAHTQRRRLALLAYLAATERAPVTRDKLIALLWPESDESSGRHSLSQLLYALRHGLGADALTVNTETVSLNPAILGSDVHSFDTALRAGQFEQAVEEYRGTFLEPFPRTGCALQRMSTIVSTIVRTLLRLQICVLVSQRRLHVWHRHVG